MSREKDNIQFRILYFIGIFLIVANHGATSFSLFYEWFPAYSFHVALFVFCSGYFFVKNKDIKILDFIKKLFKKFIIPLYVWNIIYGLFVLVLHHFGFGIGGKFTFENLLLMPIYNGHQFAFNLATWFIPPLLLSQMINYFFIKLIGNKKKLYIVHFIISLLIGFVGIYLSMKGYNKGWLLLFCRFCYFLPFFSFGILYKELLEKYDKLSNALYFIIILLISLIFIYIYGGIKTYTPSWCNDFDDLFRPFVLGLIGILFWLRISKVLEPSLKNSKIVNYISKNTYYIMIHHLMGFFLLNSIWYFIFKLSKYANGFNVNEYKTNIGYKYLPNGLYQFELLYLIFGFCFSLLLALCICKIKEYLKKAIICNKKRNSIQ